jgi:hypothetical protein
MTLVDPDSLLAASITQGTVRGVCDGSFKEHQGTSAFILQGSSRQVRLVGVNVIPGSPNSQSAYRSELGGIAGLLESLHCLCQLHEITSGKVEIGLDGDQARQEAFGHWPLDPGRPDFDLLQHIRGMIHHSPLTFTSRWVAGHQDKNLPCARLDIWGQLNVECDGLAKAFWNTTALCDGWVPNLAFGWEGWSLWIAAQKLSCIDKRKLYDHVFSDRIKQYWHRKHSLTPILITSIN